MSHPPVLDLFFFGDPPPDRPQKIFNRCCQKFLVHPNLPPVGTCFLGVDLSLQGYISGLGGFKQDSLQERVSNATLTSELGDFLS